MARLSLPSANRRVPLPTDLTAPGLSFAARLPSVHPSTGSERGRQSGCFILPFHAKRRHRARNEKRQKPLIYQGFLAFLLARATGLEPATTGSTVRYSNQLSYAPKLLVKLEVISFGARFSVTTGPTTVTSRQCRGVVTRPGRGPQQPLFPCPNLILQHPLLPTSLTEPRCQARARAEHVPLTFPRSCCISTLEVSPCASPKVSCRFPSYCSV
jgi:hypothetical protein